MRRQTAKEILVESFREVAGHKPADKITVKDITENCGYSSATFYRHFQDKYDLIAWDYSRKLEEIMSNIGQGGYAWKNTLMDAVEYYAEQKHYLSNLLRHTSGMDAFIDYMRNVHHDALKKAVLTITGQEELDEKTEMFIRIYVLGTVQLTCEWILGMFDVPPETLAEVYELSLPEPLGILMN